MEMKRATRVRNLYDTIGRQYRIYRCPDPRIARVLHKELHREQSVVNLGAGLGAYEPEGRHVIAVEPSGLMLSQRRKDAPPAVHALAESLPFRDGAFDAALAVLTIHHWSDMERGLAEARRVARRKVVLLTWIGFCNDFWLLDYFPRIRQIDEPLFPSLEDLGRSLGSVCVIPVPIPHDCTDGFLCAYWRRPEAYLDEGVRRAIFTFSRVRNIEKGLQRFEEDLRSCAWHQRYQRILETEDMDYGIGLLSRNRIHDLH